MGYKGLIVALGFSPKENASDIFIKKYTEGYSIEFDFEKEQINYGALIKYDSKTTLNFSQPENFVILECVNRLLEKGYKPQNIILEKTWAAGHGTSGRLDICVTHDDGTEYLLIECKTYGKEFEKAFSRMNKDGGQLFTYFKFSNKADIIMLYASEFNGKEIVCRNEIIKIEEDYRTGDVKDFYEKWNKLTKDNGVFDDWVLPYNFESKALIKSQLKAIRSEDTGTIFNRFLEILRHNVVSDKGNAFNKIFTLFLCKVYDETSAKDNDELLFQWKEGIDTHVTFQLRLTELYANGMQKFLERTVSDFDEDAFNKRCALLNEDAKNFLILEVNKLRLEKNNEFAIKEVYDHQSFEENAKVVKEVVELIQGYRIRYNKRQQYLSDFFELLLTTGLKQEVGQFFTPVPIAQFIIKSLPLDIIISDKLNQKNGELLPYMIDYAAGSGHFITEYMHEVQRLINHRKPKDYIDETAGKIETWQKSHFDWATKYVYGVEKDYRLVKVGKVGCYLHGDGLANMMLSDGLANFNKNKEYKGKLKKDTEDNSKDNQQFDLLLSNPPYSVSSFRQTTRDYYTEKDFELYDKLTDNSSEIECLFVERTKQLLKDGGIAGIILPSSILSNIGIYSRTREIILQYFEIIAITELGSNTFMATGTNTAVLFLRRRNNYDCVNTRDKVNNFFSTLNEVTMNGVEKPISKYIAHVWEGIFFDDYITLLKREPNENVKNHEIYKDYDKKLKAKNQSEKWQQMIEIEKEKLFYFILAYPQKVVLVKSGEKDVEKRFLGYEFSNRRGSEGIHPIQRGKTIDECTQLFDDNSFENPEKASTYIYQAFKGNEPQPINPKLEKHIFRMNLVDMMTFDRVDFEKNISLAIKKKVKIESRWEIVKIGEIAETQYGFTEKSSNSGEVRYLRITDIDDDGTIKNNDIKFINPTEETKKQFLLKDNDVVIARSGSVGKSAIYKSDKYQPMIFASYLIRLIANVNKILPDYLFCLTSTEIYWNQVSVNAVAVTQPNLNAEKIKEFKIPLPPKDIQEKIVVEVEVLEEKERKAKEEVGKLRTEIEINFKNTKGELKKLNEVCELKAGDFVKANDINKTFSSDLYPCYGGNGLRGYTKTYTNNGQYSLVGRQGALCGNVHLVSGKFHATEHALVAYPKEGVNTVWLHYQLVFMNLNQFATGTAQPGLSVVNLNPIEISLPPLSEQQRIVSEIEKIETQIKGLEQQLSEIPKSKEEILKKYL